MNQSDYDFNDHDEVSNIDIDNIKLTVSDNDPDHIPDSDEDNPQIETSKTKKSSPKISPIDTNASDKILNFNTELIYEKNKYTWRTSSKAQSEKMPARNIINIRPGPITTAK